MIQMARRSSTTLIVTGILAIIFGLVASAWPISTAVTLVIVWGVYALVDGVMALVMAFRGEGASSRGLLIFTGIIGIIAGLLAIFQPLSSGVALAWVLGIWLIVRGVVEFIGAFSEQQSRPRWLLIIGGIAWFLAGILFVANPGAAALTIALWLGLLAIVWGIFTIGAGIAMRGAAKDAQDATASTPTA